jgi:hypothetical protein
VKRGDLIRFVPNWVRANWSPPGVVIYQYPPPDEALWVVYVDGRQCVVEEDNSEIEVLTPS